MGRIWWPIIDTGHVNHFSVWSLGLSITEHHTHAAYLAVHLRAVVGGV